MTAPVTMPPEWHPQDWLWIGFPHLAEEWSGVIDKAPHSFVSFLRGPQDRDARARLQVDLVKAAPNVSVIDGREVLDTIKSVVDNVTLAVTVVGTLVVLSGLMILIGAVAML